jgi:ATP-dependent RNA helicase DeaD
VRRLHGSLLERGFDVVALSGELTQNERSHALQALRDGHARVCVATDVAARGLDLPDLGLVIHADIPTNRATLLHRSGRTGRAGRKGICVLIVPHAKRRRVEQLLNGANIKSVWSDPPTADAIRALDRERMLQDPILTEPAAEEDMAQARALLESRSAEDVAAALIRLYRARLPEPEDLFIEPFREERRRSRYEGDGDGDGRARRPDSRRTEGRVPREYRDGGENMVQFRISAGRRQNADPKWLLPMLCRRGQISKQEIGAIRIFDNETTVDIAQDVAARFIEAVRQTGGNDVRIEPADAPRSKRGERATRERQEDVSGPDRPDQAKDKKKNKRDKRPGNDTKPQAGDRPLRRNKHEAAEASAKKFKKKLKKLQKR